MTLIAYVSFDFSANGESLKSANDVFTATTWLVIVGKSALLALG